MAEDRDPDDALWAPTEGDSPAVEALPLDELDPVWQSADVATPALGVPAQPAAVTSATDPDEPTAHILIDPEHRNVHYDHVDYTAAVAVPMADDPDPAPAGPPATATPDRYYPPGYRPPPPAWRMWIIPVTIAVVGIIIALALLT